MFGKPNAHPGKRLGHVTLVIGATLIPFVILYVAAFMLEGTLRDIDVENQESLIWDCSNVCVPTGTR